MITGEVKYKGIVMCNLYRCRICGCEFYYPISDINKSATTAASTPICFKCNKII
jgi:hypothetical protein